eukprot:2852293-Prymnesium_polylepis.1
MSSASPSYDTRRLTKRSSIVGRGAAPSPLTLPLPLLSSRDAALPSAVASPAESADATDAPAMSDPPPKSVYGSNRSSKPRLSSFLDRLGSSPPTSR